MSYPPPSVPSDSSPPTGERPKIKPGKGWYWVGGLLIAGGLLGGAALGAAGVVNMVNSIEDFGRFKVEGGAGAATVTFEKPGEYSIYYESESKVCGELGSTGDEPCETVVVRGEDDPPAQLDISITSGERSLPIGPAERSLDYSFSGFSGTEVATVDVDEAGAYSMVVETRREGEFAIALGKDVVSTILPWLLGAVALAAVGLILGLIILIVTGVKRSRRKREAAMAAATAYPSAPAVFTPVARPAARPAPVRAPSRPRARGRAAPAAGRRATRSGAGPAAARPRARPGGTGRIHPRRLRVRARRPARMRGGRRPRSRPRRLRARHPSHRLLRPRTARWSRVRRMTTPRTPTTGAGTTRRRPTRPPARTSPRHRHRRHRKPLRARVDRRLRRFRRPRSRRLGPRCPRPRRHRPPELRLRS